MKRVLSFVISFQVPAASSLAIEDLESADARWGSGRMQPMHPKAPTRPAATEGAAQALDGLLTGSVALLAVPPGMGLRGVGARRWVCDGL